MIGQRLGNYRIVSEIGRGGMGAVYLAEHQTLGRPAAVKVLLPGLSADPENIRRFFNEARAATLLRHPAFVDVFDFGEHESGHAYLIMDYLDGETVGGRLRREERIPIADAVEIARQVAAAVAVAHNAGIIHRDLKPENLFLVPDPEDPERERVKILDFGVAKLAGTLAGVKGTRPGVVLGTPIFMAPEQCRGSQEIDGRADIYALACILFAMIAGRPPFVRDSAAELLIAHVAEKPPALSSLVPALPPALDQLIVRGLAKDPAARPQTMGELEAALRAVKRLFPSEATQPLPAVRANGPGATSVLTPAGRTARATRVLAETGDRRAVTLSRGENTTLGGLATETPPARPWRMRVLGLGAAGLAVAGLAAFVYGKRTGGDRPPPVAPARVDRPAAAAPETRAVFAPPDAQIAPAALAPAAEAEPAPPEPPTLAPTVLAADPVAREPERKARAVNANTVTVTVLNPRPGLKVKIDGREVRMPIVLPRDGEKRWLRFETARTEPETVEVVADRDRRIRLKHLELLHID